MSKNAVTAASGPYRRPEVYPPISFANVSEVDLHYQAEQITTPSWTPHAVDYYQRPGKPTWIHPELMNDSGTGDEILTMLWMPVMRGVDGIGNSGPIPNWGFQPSDSRSAYAGTASVFMAIDNFARRYGPWLTTLQNADRVAIVVSHRQVKVDSWGGIGGEYFTRLWEAYQACLLAHYPATFLYPEDVTPQTWSQFKALLLVDQRFELDPELVALFAEAKKHNVAVFADQTCRESLVKDFTPLPVAFNRIEELAGFNVDDAYWTYPQVLLADAPIVAKAPGDRVKARGNGRPAAGPRERAARRRRPGFLGRQQHLPDARPGVRLARRQRRLHPRAGDRPRLAAGRARRGCLRSLDAAGGEARFRRRPPLHPRPGVRGAPAKN